MDVQLEGQVIKSSMKNAVHFSFEQKLRSPFAYATNILFDSCDIEHFFKHKQIENLQ
jgi:hypothetical protein